MRVWDVDPGYLNRQSLLGEHRELHGIVSIIVHGRRGYSRHPETLRWTEYGWGLRQRHRLLASEMALRGFTDRSPVTVRFNREAWPSTWIDEPHRQYLILKGKYAGREGGRVPLPRNAQELWSHHKYSVLARDQQAYRQIGRLVSTGNCDFADLALRLVLLLRQPPSPGGARNAAEHMWGYVSRFSSAPGQSVNSWPVRKLLLQTRRLAVKHGEPYLLSSTALGELMAWAR